MGELILKDNSLDLKSNVSKFLDYIDVAEKTIETYQIALKQFIGYLYDRGIKNPTREDIIEYREHLKTYLKPTTVNGYMIAVRNLYKWMEYEDITKDVTRNVKGVKIGSEHLKEALTVEQCKSIIERAENIREKVIFVLTTTCGIRANELVNVKLEDFKERQGKICLYLLGKGRDFKEDYVIVDKDVYEMIVNYVKEYNITDYLFVSNGNRNNGGQLTTKTIRLIIKNMFKRIGIDSDLYTFHSLRHTCATLSLKEGREMREVSQMMRHKNIATTQVYAHDLEIINNQCSNTVSRAILGYKG